MSDENGGVNGVQVLKAYFSTDDKPVNTSEMMEFWKSLSPAEKEYYKTAKLI